MLLYDEEFTGKILEIDGVEEFGIYMAFLGKNPIKDKINEIERLYRLNHWCLLFLSPGLLVLKYEKVKPKRKL